MVFRTLVLLGGLYISFLLLMYLLSRFSLFFFSSSSFYFFLIWQSLSLFAIIHYFRGLSFNIKSLCYILMVLLSDILIVYGFISVCKDFLNLGFTLKLSFFPFLWVAPTLVLGMSYLLVFILVFFHKSVIVIVFYYLVSDLSLLVMLIVLFSILASSIFLLLNKSCFKSLLIWSSKAHCGWFLLLLRFNSYAVFSYIALYLVFGFLFIFVFCYGYDYVYISDIVGLDYGFGVWLWFSFLFFCSFPPLLGWIMKFLVYSVSYNYVILISFVLVNLFRTFGYLVVLRSFFVCLPYWNRYVLCLYSIPLVLLLVGFFVL